MLLFILVTRQRYGYAQSPACVYSLPDKVQGVCELPNGDIVLSTSYGLAGSHLLTYRPVNQAATPVAELPAQQGGGNDAVAAQPVGDTFAVNGKQVPLYYFDSTNLVTDLSAPPMSEGIEYHDGRIYISEEAASNKYIFGKLYGAGIYSLPRKRLHHSQLVVIPGGFVAGKEGIGVQRLGFGMG